MGLPRPKDTNVAWLFQILHYTFSRTSIVTFSCKLTLLTLQADQLNTILLHKCLIFKKCILLENTMFSFCLIS